MESPPQLDEAAVKVVVIGEPRCGKTRFIRAYYDHHFPDVNYSYNGVRVYPCKFEATNEMRRVSIFEIPSDPDFLPEERIPNYEEADVIVFMYAIDDPLSLKMLTEKWILEANSTIASHRKPVVFVGAKKDLQEDQQVIQRLALEKKSPLTLQQGRELFDKVPGEAVIVECSANDLELVEFAFNTIFAIVLMNE
ncbi:hypothetical protein AVEN_157162-1 [Araneus ventricosus]|uniref:Uncharacterized protein n=1 Tax=Araneus ventricosus TaxID=182803 RepID=A0A4Y2KPR1_ARAVE|nr:hypothetical protein AVEN_157162-1 [Araneus ventricosus]